MRLLEITRTYALGMKSTPPSYSPHAENPGMAAPHYDFDKFEGALAYLYEDLSEQSKCKFMMLAPSLFFLVVLFFPVVLLARVESVGSARMWVP